VAESDALSKISKLIEMYPWNNFLQLKCINIYEEMLEAKEA
jgi:antitoxin component HigA of HigAB toxin-antitoxin module